MAIRHVASIFQREETRLCRHRRIRGTKVLYIDDSARMMLAAEAKTGVRHHVALSIVGSEGANDT
jgi:hypothetical protein